MPSHLEIHYPTPTQPRQIRLDSTTRCNAHCLSCHRFMSKRKGEMPNELIAQLLDDASKWEKPPEEIVPVNYGEFFLREDWFEILVQITRKLPYTTITLATNGSLVDEKTVSLLCKIPTFRVINFSINAYFDETYEMFNGLKAETIPQIRKAVTQFRILRPDIRLKVSMVFDPMYHSDLQRDFFQSYWMGWAEPWVIPAASACRGTEVKILRVIPCRSIFSDFVIGFDGKLSSCCFDPNFTLDLGNIADYGGNVLEAWRNPKLQQLRDLHNANRRQEIPLCKGCTFE